MSLEGASCTLPAKALLQTQGATTSSVLLPDAAERDGPDYTRFFRRYSPGVSW